jgi:hypothetical protein
MSDHFQYSDEEFDAVIADCTIDPALFNHEAHLRLAWIHLRRSGVEQAVVSVEERILGLVDFLGARDKFNKTLTIAAVRTVHHFLQRSGAQTFRELIAEFPRLKTHFRELIAAHYSFDVFHLQEAKETWMEPDLLSYEIRQR